MSNQLSPCPSCSRFRRRHPELSDDFIARPMIQHLSKSNRYMLTGGCEHSRALSGSADNEQELVDAWQSIVDLLWDITPEEKKEDVRQWTAKEEQETAQQCDFTLGKHELLK